MKKGKIKRNLQILVYYPITAWIVSYPFKQAVLNGEPWEKCFLKFLYAFLIVDILCSILEDIPSIIIKLYKRFKVHVVEKKEEKQKKEAEQLQQKMKEKIQNEEEKQRKVLEGNEEFQKIEEASIVYERLVNIMQEKLLDAQVTEKFQDALEEIHFLLEILEEDNSAYKKAEYMLTVCLPELENITKIYLNVLKIVNSGEEESRKDYLQFLEVFQQYMQSIKEEILSSSKMDLKVNTSVMESVMNCRM